MFSRVSTALLMLAESKIFSRRFNLDVTKFFFLFALLVELFWTKCYSNVKKLLIVDCRPTIKLPMTLRLRFALRKRVTSFKSPERVKLLLAPSNQLFPLIRRECCWESCQTYFQWSTPFQCPKQISTNWPITIVSTFIWLYVFMFYEMKMFYAAMRNGCSYGSPHTVCFHYSPLDVHNLHDLPVSDDQIKGRSLMKTFAVAAAAARQEFGVGFF